MATLRRYLQCSGQASGLATDCFDVTMAATGVAAAKVAIRGTEDVASVAMSMLVASSLVAIAVEVGVAMIAMGTKFDANAAQEGCSAAADLDWHRATVRRGLHSLEGATNELLS